MKAKPSTMKECNRIYKRLPLKEQTWKAWMQILKEHGVNPEPSTGIKGRLGV